MSKKQTPSPLHDCLILPDVAKFLSTILKKEINNADVLRLVLDGRLELSVDFVNHTRARRGNFDCDPAADDLSASSVSTDLGFSLYSVADALPLLPRMELSKELPKDTAMALTQDMGKVSSSYNFFSIDEKLFRFEDTVSTIEGVWDLPMVGNERQFVEQEYQRLTGGPAITVRSLSGAFVERKEDGLICQLQECLSADELSQLEQRFIDADTPEKNRPSKREEKPFDHLDNYKPADGLPSDSVLVVRKQALTNFEKSLSSERLAKKTSQPKKVEDQKDLCAKRLKKFICIFIKTETQKYFGKGK